MYHPYNPDFAYRYCRVDRGDEILTLDQLTELAVGYLLRSLD